mmetsp:Transcript_70950/g.123017  ORF Transcript_70950/g.123017 Transcript_70950/m.123017 type:complete len:941 (+) Transcript_70950:165-2987(+)
MKMGTQTHDMEEKKDDKNDGKDTRKISKDEAAFILGSQGKTKNKLANVSGAQIDLVELKNDQGASQLEIRGDAKQRTHAMQYIDYVLSQRKGPVKIDESLHPDDLTILRVPADTVSFITGTKGAYLRLVEDEWWTLLFFLMVNPKAPPVNVDPQKTESLAIFGPKRARRGAELKVMAAIEEKRHGYFTKNGCPHVSQEDGFATDTMLISEDDYSYALGKSGNTRKKLARASSCIVEYIGRVAYFSGSKIERTRAKEYLQWLLQQRVGEHAKVDHKGREDVTVVTVPRNCLGYLTGHKGSSLRQIEEETSTFCFLESPAEDAEDGQKLLLIFGRPEDRRFAESLVYERISQKMDEPSHDHGYSSGRKGKGRSGKADSGKGKGGNHRDGRDGGRDGRDTGRDGGRSGNRADWAGNDVERERPSGPGISSDFLTISEDDAAFLNGPNGRTKNKIAAVSGAFLELKNTKLEIAGTKEQRERADKYVKIVMKQRLGPVMLEDSDEHDDLLIIEVPAAAVSFVTGRGGTFLRMVEEEFSTLLFFINFSKSNKRDQLEKLAIFGPERERRGAELKVMAAIETKQTGYFTNRFNNSPLCDASEGYGMDRMVIQEDDYSYALGKFGATRKKIAKASGCVIEYIGRYAYLSGSKPERIRAREYLGWLFRQRVGPVEVDYSNRDDVTVLPVPKDCVGFVTGHKGTSLRAVEEATGTFCFIEGGRDDPHRDPKPLLIFGATDARRVAQEMLQQRIDQKLEAGWVHEDYTYRGYQDSGGKGDSKGGRSRDGARRPPRGHKGGSGGEERGQGAAATASTTPATDPSPTAPPAVAEKVEVAPQAEAETKEELVEQEDDEAWGDWGGASEDEPIDESSAGGGAGAGAAEMGGHTPTAGGATPSSAAKWLNQPVPVTYKASDLRGEELEMPPQLLHEEAWPELGAMGAKSGSKAKRR